MPVSIRGKRFVFGTVAIVAATLLYGIVLGAPTALAVQPYVTETPVPGSIASQIADGLNASWVAGAIPDIPPAIGFINQITRIEPGLDPTQTSFVVALPSPPSPRPEDLTVTHVLSTPTNVDAVWAAGTLLDLHDPRNQPTAYLFRLDPNSTTNPVAVVSDVGFHMLDVASDSSGNVWYVEESLSGQQFRIGGFDNFESPVPPRTFPGAADFLVPRPQEEALWFIEHVGVAPGTEKIAKLDLSIGNPTSGMISAEYDLGAGVNADSLISGPDDALWFREKFATGGTSITRMPTTGPDAGIPQRHDVSTILQIGVPTDGSLATADDAIWFTTGNAIGRMTPAGDIDKLLCVAPSTPYAIVAGPEAHTLTFTEFTDRIGRIPTDAVGLPCPVPVVPGGVGFPKKSVLDTTPAKISLSGKATQRFTSKGVLVVTVRCNEDCLATGQASVSTPGASRLFRSNKASKIIDAGKSAKLTLKFKKKAVKTIRRFLKKKKTKKRLKAKLTIAVTDGAGNKSTGRRTVKLKR